MEKGKKYIHYCWFGGKKLPRFAKKCIKSWKKYLPEYEIVCWNESNVDLDECPFIKEAYEQKKWAFVADYARTKALYEYGGIYLDTDMMIKKSVDFLLDKPTFVGVEDSGYVNAAVWGAKEPRSFLSGEVLKFYKGQKHFSGFDLYSITIPVIMTNILSRSGFDRKNDGLQIVRDVYIYPREYFYPLSYDYENNVFTKNTCMIHYSEASWTSATEKRDIKLIRIFGRKKAGIILKVAKKIKDLIIYYSKVVWRTILLIFLPVRYFVKRTKRKDDNAIQNIVKKIKNTKEKYIVFAHEGWLGVESSTRGLFGDIIMIGDYDITSDFRQIINAIVDNHKIRMVVFSAFGDGWEYLARKIKEAKPDIIIKVFWHGSNAMHIEGFDANRFYCVFDLLNAGVVDSIAFAKKSMYEQYKELGYNVEFLPNTVNLTENEKKEIKREKCNHSGMQIGIYASGDRWVKNFYNQMAAASLLDDVSVDIIPISESQLQFAKILKMPVTGETKNVSRMDLLKRIVQDDIVLYATFVECAPIVPLECLELGVPCITGDNHHYWVGTKLEEYLVEPKTDNPVAIADRLRKCLKNKDSVLKLYAEWKKDYDVYCSEELKKFLNNC